MPSAGHRHSCFLCSNGAIATCGLNEDGQCRIPELPTGLFYQQVAAGGIVTVVLRSDGRALACGGPFTQQEQPFQLFFAPGCPQGYIQVAAGYDHVVLLRSDGQAETHGANGDSRKLWVPKLEDGMTYTHVAAGDDHTVFLRRDGDVVASGNDNYHGQCTIPMLSLGLKYTKIAAGYDQTLLLRSDGRLVLCGRLKHWGYNIAIVEQMSRAFEGIQLLDDQSATYTQLSVGSFHIALLRSDGMAVTVGPEPDVFRGIGHCRIPRLDDGVSYVEVSAGDAKTVLLRSDGIAVSFGHVSGMTTNMYSLGHGMYVVATSLSPGLYIVQLSVTRTTTGATHEAFATDLAGARIASWVVADRSRTVHQGVRMNIPQTALQLRILFMGLGCDGSSRQIYPWTTWEYLDMEDFMTEKKSPSLTWIGRASASAS